MIAITRNLNRNVGAQPLHVQSKIQNSCSSLLLILSVSMRDLGNIYSFPWLPRPHTFYLYLYHVILIICLLHYNKFFFWSKLPTQQVLSAPPASCFHCTPFGFQPHWTTYSSPGLHTFPFTGSSEPLHVPFHPHGPSKIYLSWDVSWVLLHPGSLPWSLTPCNPTCSSCVHDSILLTLDLVVNIFDPQKTAPIWSLLSPPCFGAQRHWMRIPRLHFLALKAFRLRLLVWCSSQTSAPASVRNVPWDQHFLLSPLPWAFLYTVHPSYL